MAREKKEPGVDGDELTIDSAELAEFRAYRDAKAKAEAKARDRDSYRQLVDETVNDVFPGLMEVSEGLRDVKDKTYEVFACALDLKGSIFEVKADQRSHTFTNIAGNRRIILGDYLNDAYDDTVEEGIAKVKEFIGSLAKDDDSRMLVKAVLKLLSKDQKGNLKASRVMQLRKMADDSGNGMFIEGVRIIEEAYRPAKTKTFVRAEYKNDKGAWINVPLGMTEA
jgi:hypothetical protein